MHDFLATLGKHAWQIAPPVPGVGIPDPILARYGPLPAELASFISSFSACSSPSGKAWFVSNADLARDGAFLFDAIERMSIAAADTDEEWAAAIRAFWQTHFPLLLSANRPCEYFALCLSGPTRGCVVHGREPAFEDCSVIAPSLAAFLEMFAAALATPAPAYPFSVVLLREAV